MISPVCGIAHARERGLARLGHAADQRLAAPSPARGPEMRTTAIAAGGRPEERAKMVGRVRAHDRVEANHRIRVKVSVAKRPNGEVETHNGLCHMTDDDTKKGETPQKLNAPVVTVRNSGEPIKLTNVRFDGFAEKTRYQVQHFAYLRVRKLNPIKLQFIPIANSTNDMLARSFRSQVHQKLHNSLGTW